MKKFNYVLLSAITATFFGFMACKKNDESKKQELNVISMKGICEGASTLAAKPTKTTDVTITNQLPYKVELLTRKNNGDGTYTWVWAVSNPNPGNGLAGTVQDLSHWGITLGCATLKDIVSAGTSTDGIKWNSFTPSYSKDKSQDCYTSPILKFDVGTKASAKTYYKLTLNKNFPSEKREAVYKSGSKTGCGVFQICGIGCIPK